jgi:hypothetical protein
MPVNLCSAVSACGGSFTSFISSITSNLTNCMSFGVFSQMAVAPQVVGDSVVVSYSDAGGVNFATVVLQCGSASLSAAIGAAKTATNMQGGNNYVFVLQSSAVCFPVPVPTPLPLPTPSPGPSSDASSPSQTTSAGAIVGIVIGVCAGLAIAAALVFNWRRNQMRARTVVTKEAPYMASSTVQGDKLMDELI